MKMFDENRKKSQEKRKCKRPIEPIGILGVDSFFNEEYE